MGRYDLNLEEEEFWALTIKEFNALVERYNNNQEWLNHRTALICSVLANIWRDPKRKQQPFRPADFMPEVESRQQTPKQILATVKVLNAAFGGKENK